MRLGLVVVVRGNAERTHSFRDLRHNLIIGTRRPVVGVIFRFSLHHPIFFFVRIIFQFREARPVLRAVVFVEMVVFHELGNLQDRLLDGGAVQIRQAQPRKDVRRQQF